MNTAHTDFDEDLSVGERDKGVTLNPYCYSNEFDTNDVEAETRELDAMLHEDWNRAQSPCSRYRVGCGCRKSNGGTQSGGS